MNNSIDNKKSAESLYLILASVFVASLVSCNLILQKFFTMDIWIPFVGNYTFEQSVGLLPYPVTFLVTDIISEVYGQKRANKVVTSGLFASLFMLIVVTISDMVQATVWSPVDNQTFSRVFGLSGAAVFASMIAYLSAHFIDVRVFHFWKKLTKGKHLWLRNNGSTFVSQFVDTAAVLILLCSAGAIEWSRFLPLLENGFLFKIMVALIDTPIIYGVIHLLKGKIEIAKY